jgi:hypothetical protein
VLAFEERELTETVRSYFVLCTVGGKIPI